MAVTAASFRQAFPEFASAAQYPAAQVDFWLQWSVMTVNPNRWRELTDMGVQLSLAHNLSLEAQALAAAEDGGTPGAATGPVSSKSVDKVSVGYDVGVASVDGAGPWNLTTYGTRYVYLARLIGAGPLQSGPGCPTGPGGAYAWPGPNPY